MLPETGCANDAIVPADDALSVDTEREIKRGHNRGRLPAGAYHEAKVVPQPHETLCAGGACPCGNGGRLYPLPPGEVIRVTGGSFMQVTQYQCERLRCGRCGDVFTASLAAEAGEGKYSLDFKSSLAINHYYLGIPFYRLSSYQKHIHMPLPVSTQWHLVEEVGGCAVPIFQALLVQAAQRDLIHYDDTKVRILQVSPENRSDPTRTGCYTTGLLARGEGPDIYLFLSGLLHAGENVEQVLAKRQAGLPKPLGMSDALNANGKKALQTILIRCLCLSHGVRKFKELRDVFPEECGVVLKALGQVYTHEATVQAKGLSPPERLSSHQACSGRIMATLKSYLETELTAHRVEPNGELGQAFRYLLKHWTGLTAFLREVGAPLDNNIIERALKIAIRARKTSLFYKTVYGAWLGSVLTSVVHTCIMADENPVFYLTMLQRHGEAVMQHPEAFLPWTYRETLELKAENQQAA